MERSGAKQTGGEPLNERDLETVRTLFHALAFRMRGVRSGGITSGNTCSTFIFSNWWPNGPES